MQTLITSDKTVSTNCKNVYSKTISNLSTLSVEEEQKLAKDFQLNNNLESAKKLILSHIRFVIYVAKKYKGYGLPECDIIQEGNIGLMKAVKNFDPDNGVRLCSYAVFWIKAEIHEYVLKNWRIVKIATTKAQRKLFFNLRKLKKHSNAISENEALTIADKLNVDKQDVYKMDKRMLSPEITYDSSENIDDDFAPEHFLMDHSSDFASNIISLESHDHDKNNLLHAISTLDERSQFILKHRWLNESKITLKELSNKFNVSQERIRQLEKNAMNRIKDTLLAA